MSIVFFGDSITAGSNSPISFTDCIKDIKLADCPLKKIDFCVLREDKSIGKYELIQSFDL